MKIRHISLFMALMISAALLLGCARNAGREVIATIGDYSLYKEDFLSELALYPPDYREPLTKEQVLDNIIEKKILLLEAQREGLDKDPNFMKMIERFWEQSLLRALLDKKSQEILSSIPETEKDRTRKAAEMMNYWADGLKDKTKVKINTKTLEKIDVK